MKLTPQNVLRTHLPKGTPSFTAENEAIFIAMQDYAEQLANQRARGFLRWVRDNYIPLDRGFWSPMHMKGKVTTLQLYHDYCEYLGNIQKTTSALPQWEIWQEPAKDMGDAVPTFIGRVCAKTFDEGCETFIFPNGHLLEGQKMNLDKDDKGQLVRAPFSGEQEQGGDRIVLIQGNYCYWGLQLFPSEQEAKTFNRSIILKYIPNE